MKSTVGRFFEDFQLNETIQHAPPRTLTEGDVALYHALTGNRFSLQISNKFARDVGYHAAPLDDMLVFNAVFGLTVQDISLNAVANLGYADCDFLAQIYAEETISARSRVIGLRETSDGKNGIVYVESEGLDHRGAVILRYSRWVMVPKRTPGTTLGINTVPTLPDKVARITVPRQRLNRHWDDSLAGSPYRWEDYEAGEKIDHFDGVTIEEAEHMMATRLYRNAARVHFNGLMASKSASKRRLVYGGHIMTVARALSHNGLGNASIIAAINAGRHSAPVHAGDTIYAWTEVIGKLELEGRKDIGALRLKTRAFKNTSCAAFPTEGDAMVLEWDYTVIMPRR